MRMATWLRIPNRLMPGGYQAQHLIEFASVPLFLDATEIEGDAESALERADSPSRCPSQRLVALASSVPSVPVTDSDVEGRVFNGVIYYDRRLSRREVNYVCAHELAHHGYRDRPHRHVDVIALGWALLVPRSVVVAEGWDVQRLARRLHTVPRWVIYARVTILASHRACNDVEPLVLSGT